MPRRVRAAADVRSQYNVVHRFKTRVWAWIVLVHIEPGASDSPVLQCMYECSFIDHAATRHIDEKGSRAERIQYVRIDQVTRLLATCHGHNEKIGPLGQPMHRFCIEIR
ncbi:hypothetical protein BDD18_3084 [Acidovorax temperans]|uniref:Uncharacterized protein n=2 Tax=Acidovorax TaxID=12916 RepID=A0A543L1D3_9BURK|nr:hypothetical protein BDD18_3084 [Acidovorax temperans]SEA88625.1 hypothetical protein SAMN05421875_14122 [Acidovorax soli]